MIPRTDWRDAYDDLVREFIAKHFGSARGVTSLFPYMKPDFKWRQKDDIPSDARVALKNNEEYHGLERHAKQYHLSAENTENKRGHFIGASPCRSHSCADKLLKRGLHLDCFPVFERTAMCDPVSS